MLCVSHLVHENDLILLFNKHVNHSENALRKFYGYHINKATIERLICLIVKNCFGAHLGYVDFYTGVINISPRVTQRNSFVKFPVCFPCLSTPSYMASSQGAM